MARFAYFISVMKPLAAIFIFVFQYSLGAHAGGVREIAQTPGGSGERAAATSSLPDVVRRLFGPGQVPSVSSLDVKYSGKFGSKQCRKTVQELRAATVRSRPVMDSDSLIARAVKAGVDRRQVERVLAVFLANQDKIPNQKFITVIDFNKRSDQKRMFIIDVTTGEVSGYHTAAGRGSDPGRGSGYATRFSNEKFTNASSLGCALAAGTYNGQHGKSLMLHGFEATNDNSCERNIVIHKAPYVGAVPGRSEGCPAVKSSVRDEVFKKIQGGGLVCSFKDGEVLEATRKLSGKKKRYKKRAPAKAGRAYRRGGRRGRRR